MSSGPKARRGGKPSRVTAWQLIGTAIFCLLALAYLFPLLWLADSAFRPAAEAFQIPPALFQDPVGAVQRYSLDGFRTAIVQWGVGRGFAISVLVTLCSVGLSLPVCSLCAYAFAFIQFRGKGPLFIVILGTMMVPMTTLMVPMVANMRVLHLTDSLLGLILPYALSPFGVFLLRQYYIKIPPALMESARVDGASHARIWLSVILPLSKPALAAVAIFEFLFVWNDYLIPTVLLRSEALQTLPIRLQVMMSNRIPPLGSVMAGGFVTAFVPLVFFLVFQRQFIEGLTGGIKE